MVESLENKGKERYVEKFSKINLTIKHNNDSFFVFGIPDNRLLNFI